MTPFRIRLPDCLFPLQAFLNASSDTDYLPMLRRMSVGVESTFNEAGWRWWNGEDESPPPPGKLLFYVYDEEINLSVSEAMKYLRAATGTWLLDHYTSRDEAEGLL